MHIIPHFRKTHTEHSNLINNLSGLIILVYVIVHLYVIRDTPGIDFIQFYKSAERFRRDESLYFPGGDWLAFAGTATYFIFLPLTFLKINLAYLTFSILNYALLFIISYKTCTFYNKKLTASNLLFVFSLLTFSFPVRSIINSGQTGLIYGLLVLILVKKITSIDDVKIQGLLLFLIFEIKIYLAIPIICYMLVTRSIKVILNFTIILILIQPIYL
jgi:hypothetical protein